MEKKEKGYTPILEVIESLSGKIEKKIDFVISILWILIIGAFLLILFSIVDNLNDKLVSAFLIGLSALLASSTVMKSVLNTKEINNQEKQDKMRKSIRSLIFNLNDINQILIILENKRIFSPLNYIQVMYISNYSNQLIKLKREVKEEVLLTGIFEKEMSTELSNVFTSIDEVESKISTYILKMEQDKNEKVDIFKHINVISLAIKSVSILIDHLEKEKEKPNF